MFIVNGVSGSSLHCINFGAATEPSCGIGNFIGMLPKTMQDSKIYGVELDTISAGIAQQLYQKSSIAAQGFENVNIPDSFFDGVVGNVPFGDFKVVDKKYDKHNFLIHDYFFAKSLDKLRPGGVMALITSKGTMDKENSSVRKYIAQRAELLGAIRLPNDTFKSSAGTEVVSDILFLQKRDRLIDIEPDWVHLDTNENGIRMNSYFVQNPEMVLGEMKTVSGRFGQQVTCEPYTDSNLADLLSDAIANIHGEISDYENDVATDELEEDMSIPADASVKNFSYSVVNDKLYFRENSRMIPVTVSATAESRIKGLIIIRDCTRNLIELQADDYPEEDIKAAQELLNAKYDNFTAKYGLINSRANKSAFSDDSSFALVSALEILGDEGQLERKADIFFKRTIMPHKPITQVDTASESLAVSIGEKACIDMEYMQIRHNTSEPDRITEWFGDYAMYASKKLDREEMNNIFATKFVKLLLDEWFNGFRGEKSIEKEFFEHISRLNSECFKNSLPNNLEDWEKAIINELEGVSKQVASGNIPILQERTKIYIDMDGTIARFHDENLYLERMFEKGFFIDLKPFENAVYAIEQLVNDSTAEIFILSATVNSCSLDEKQKWLDRYLPNIDKEHRIFTSLNVPKSEAIGHRLTDKDILIDDYNKNLLEWQKAGGTSVKAKNNINHKGLHGELWKGELIDVVNGDVYSDICKLANENYYYAYIGENDVEKLKNSGICYHLQMSGDRIIAKVSIAYKPILDNIVNSNRSIKCDTGSTPKM